MNIYEIGQDFDNYKFFVFKEEDKSNKDVWDYNGQSLVEENFRERIKEDLAEFEKEYASKDWIFFDVD
mgnify:CR=1 FL=1